MRIISILIFFTVLAFSNPLFACLWDSDTIADEIKNRRPIINAIVGNVAQYPDKYYEMRLERVTQEIVEGKKTPALFDNAGVAANKLKDYDSAIKWMEKKEIVLTEMGKKAKKDDWYRLYANWGTFYVHKFMIQPDKSDLSALKKSRAYIQKAIAIQDLVVRENCTGPTRGRFQGEP